MALEITYWLTIGLAAVVAIVAFKLLAASAVGSAVPGLAELGAFI